MRAFRPEYEIAIEFLRSRGHRVGDYSQTTQECCIDDLNVSDLGIIVIAQTYRREWLEYLTDARLSEVHYSRPRVVA